MGGTAVRDVVVERFGIRVWGKDSEGRITLNGERVKLHGYNRHSMTADTGSANTLAEIKKDLGLLKQLNSVFLRGGHYPQDQRLLDLCDELGIAVWEETVGPGVLLAHARNADFMKQQLIQIEEMISASVNHPSIAFWGFWNEGESNNAAICSGYKTNVDAIHKRDPTRFVTWANMYQLGDKCMHLADVVSWNWYPAWYDRPGDTAYPAQFWNWAANSVAAAFPTKPFIISEAGCEGIYEWTNTTAVLWSQTLQVPILKSTVTAALTNANVSGISLWIFADFKGNDMAQASCGPCPYAPGTSIATFVDTDCDAPGRLSNRPCGCNHKGTVDLWRRPKASFPIVQELYGKCGGTC
jgi:beta-glucuronidase